MKTVRTIYYLIAVAALGGLFSLKGELDGAVPPSPYDPEEQIRFLDEWLQSFPDQYSINIAHSFNRNSSSTTTWMNRGNSTEHFDIRYIEKTPPEKPFRMEQDLLEKYGQYTEFPGESLFLNFSVHTPGQEQFILRPMRKNYIDGRLAYASMWVYSYGRRDRILLIFEDQDHHVWELDGGPLDFHGWRRLSISAPPRAHILREREGVNYRFALTGIKIQSSRFSDPGDVALIIDNLLVIGEKSGLKFPGMEQPDGW